MKPVVIVTGSSGGLGGEIALRFGMTGASVVLNDIDYLDDAETLSIKIRQSGGDALVYRADVCQYKQVEAMVDATMEKWGRIDVLVNNAGGGARWLGQEGKSILEMAESDWDHVLNINLKASFLCIKAVAPPMIKNKSGHIFNIFSGHALRGAKRFSAYSAAKAGVIGLTRSAAQELGPHNIKVNAVSPGLILHSRIAAEGRIAQERVKPWLERSVLGRTGSAQEFAEFVVHLSRTENIAGQVLDLDNTIHA